jgi:pyruvate formate lyase activating enzyme
MTICGFQKVTLLDFPGEVASTLFTYGCNMRCPFCHNPELVIEKMNNDKCLKWEEVISYLEKRKKLLGGVCFTGGEPLLQNDIKEKMEEIKKLGLKVKIDTNGTLPDKLKKLKPDYIAMDIKTSFKKYNLMGYTGKEDLNIVLNESIKWIMSSGIDYEFRTTVVPELVEFEDLKEILSYIKGAGKYILAQFRNNKLVDDKYESKIPYKKEVLENMKTIVNEHKIDCEIRANY